MKMGKLSSEIEHFSCPLFSAQIMKITFLLASNLKLREVLETLVRLSNSQIFVFFCEILSQMNTNLMEIKTFLIDFHSLRHNKKRSRKS